MTKVVAISGDNDEVLGGMQQRLVSTPALTTWHALAYSDYTSFLNELNARYVGVTHLEIVGHGSPGYCADIDLWNYEDFCSQLLKLDVGVLAPDAILILSGCNTGTWYDPYAFDPSVCGLGYFHPDPNLAELIACCSGLKVWGSRGYLTASTYAEYEENFQKIDTFATLSIGEVDTWYCGGTSAEGKECFTEFSGCPAPRIKYLSTALLRLVDALDRIILEEIDIVEILKGKPMPAPTPGSKAKSVALWRTAPDAIFAIKHRGRTRKLGLLANGSVIKDMDSGKMWKIGGSIAKRRKLLLSLLPPIAEDAYKVEVKPSSDGRFVATVAEFGNMITAIGDTPQEAMKNAYESIRQISTTLRRGGLHVPKPNTLKKCRCR